MIYLNTVYTVIQNMCGRDCQLIHQILSKQSAEVIWNETKHFFSRYFFKIKAYRFYSAQNLNDHFSETHPPKSEHCSDLENGTEKWTLPNAI